MTTNKLEINLKIKKMIRRRGDSNNEEIRDLNKQESLIVIVRDKNTLIATLDREYIDSGSEQTIWYMDSVFEKLIGKSEEEVISGFYRYIKNEVLEYLRYSSLTDEIKDLPCLLITENKYKFLHEFFMKEFKHVECDLL